MSTTTLPRLTLAAALALALACGSSAPERRPSPSPAQAGDEAPAGANAPASKSANSGPARRELSPKAQRLFDEAVAAGADDGRKKIDWETVERRWRAVTDVEEVPEAWFNLGVALERRGQVDEARDAYKHAVRLEPDLGAAAVNLALLDEPKDPRDAVQLWKDLLSRFPEESVPRVRLAAFYEAAGQRDEAWKLAREALVRDPRAVGAYKVMMRVALQRGNSDLAQLLAVKARKLDDRDPEIVAFVGDVLLRQKDELGAVAQWKKAIALKDDYLPARYQLLGEALSKRRWEAVADQSRAILRSAPDDAKVQLALGVAYRYLGQPDKALAAYDQAEKMGGNKVPEVHLARGVVLMKSKEQCEPALDALKRYIAAAGPGAAAEGPAGRLIQECSQIIAANKAAEAAAQEMKAEAEKEAQRKAAAAGAKAAAQAPGDGDDKPPAPTK